VIASCYKIVESQTSYTLYQGIGSWCLSRKIWKGRNRSRTFYLRLRNPDFRHPTVYLLCPTAIRRDFRAAWCCCNRELPCSSVECVLLHCCNWQPYIFAAVNCADVVVSVFYQWLVTGSPPVFQRVACSYELLCRDGANRKFVSSASALHRNLRHFLSSTPNSNHYFCPLTRSTVLPLKSFCSANCCYKSCI